MQATNFRRSRFGKAFLSLFAGLTLAIGAGFLISHDTSDAASSAALPALASPARAGGEAAFPASGTFAPLVKTAAPAVVSIQSERTQKMPDMQGMMPFFFGPFGGPQGPQGEAPERKQRGIGSGVIVTPDGYILTNHHVIEDADEVTVILDDERELDAEIVGSDPKTDIAVLKVDAENLPTLQLGNSAGVEVGDIVLAIGNPFGVGQTVTQGIVGATSRQFGITGGGYEDFIQTDAAINPGNSGGALINARGQLIGINTAIMSRSGGNNGVGFAVPVNLAHHVMEQLVEHGRVVRGYMGVGIQDVDATMSKQLDLPDSKGAVVTSVEEDGPASAAGLERYDVIREIDGDAIDNTGDLRLRVAAKAPGETIDVAVLRDGELRNLNVTLGEFPEDDAERPAARRGQPSALDGVEVDELTPQTARQLRLPGDLEGVVVTRVNRSSPAAEAGLAPGDVIQEVARKPVTSVGEFRDAVKQSGDDSLLLLVWSRGGSRLVVIEP